MKRDIWLAVFGLLGGLLAAGLLYLAAGRPRGQPVQLLQPPTPAPIQVHVAGSVTHPGVYSLPRASRVQEAIQAAGGLLPEADQSALNLAAQVKDGDRLEVPALPPTPETITIIPGETRYSGIPSSASPSSFATQPAQGGKVNINTANLDELDTLPGIGPVTAQKIIDYRQTYGPFQTVESIVDVSGIGPATFERLKDLITVGKTP